MLTTPFLPLRRRAQRPAQVPDDGRLPGGGPRTGLHPPRISRRRAEEGRPRRGRHPGQPFAVRPPRPPLAAGRGGLHPDGGSEGGLRVGLPARLAADVLPGGAGPDLLRIPEPAVRPVGRQAAPRGVQAGPRIHDCEFRNFLGELLNPTQIFPLSTLCRNRAPSASCSM